MSGRPGIPTMYRDIEYRSLTEARYAAFFERIGWQSTYEPFEGNGYILDLLIHGDRPLAVCRARTRRQRQKAVNGSRMRIATSRCRRRYCRRCCCVASVFSPPTPLWPRRRCGGPASSPPTPPRIRPGSRASSAVARPGLASPISYFDLKNPLSPRW